MNPHIHPWIPAQNEFEDFDWTQYYQNQLGATQMGGTHGTHGGSSSKEERKYAGIVNKFVAPKK